LCAQYLVRLQKLDVAIVDHLDQVSPRVIEVEPDLPEDTDAQLIEAGAHGLLIVDDEAEMARLVARLAAPLDDCDELIAHVDEGGPPNFAAKLERAEDRFPEGERLLEVADF
jgi:hypothetical protein